MATEAKQLKEMDIRLIKHALQKLEMSYNRDVVANTKIGDVEAAEVFRNKEKYVNQLRNSL